MSGSAPMTSSARGTAAGRSRCRCWASERRMLGSVAIGLDTSPGRLVAASKQSGDDGEVFRERWVAGSGPGYSSCAGRGCVTSPRPRPRTVIDPRTSVLKLTPPCSSRTVAALARDSSRWSRGSRPGGTRLAREAFLAQPRCHHRRRHLGDPAKHPRRAGPAPAALSLCRSVRDSAWADSGLRPNH